MLSKAIRCFALWARKRYLLPSIMLKAQPRSQQTFSAEGQTVNTRGLAGCPASPQALPPTRRLRIRLGSGPMLGWPAFRPQTPLVPEAHFRPHTNPGQNELRTMEEKQNEHFVVSTAAFISDGFSTQNSRTEILNKAAALGKVPGTRTFLPIPPTPQRPAPVSEIQTRTIIQENEKFHYLFCNIAQTHGCLFGARYIFLAFI